LAIEFEIRLVADGGFHLAPKTKARLGKTSEKKPTTRPSTLLDALIARTTFPRDKAPPLTLGRSTKAFAAGTVALQRERRTGKGRPAGVS